MLPFLFYKLIFILLLIYVLLYYWNTYILNKILSELTVMAKLNLFFIALSVNTIVDICLISNYIQKDGVSKIFERNWYFYSANI